MSLSDPSMIPDLDICAREPITFLEHIQSFGFLVGVSNDWTVVRASANLNAFLGIEAEQAIGMPADRVIAKTALHDIRNRLVTLQPIDGTERLFGVKLGSDYELFDVALHYAGDVLIIEGEPCGRDEPMGAATLVRSMMARLQAQSSLTGFYRDVARQVRSITGFDRAMVYRFAADGSGEVVAEASKGSNGSLMGLHYPASDIPEQARALYLRTPFRIIADVAAPSVPLLPAVSGATPPLDLSLAVTRAVSPVHIEYLRNMDVAASLSISIIVDGKLWGMVACHNSEAKLPSFVMRSAAELFGAMLSLTLEGRLRAAAIAQDDNARGLADRLLLTISSTPELLTDPDWLMDTVGDLIPCDGAAVYLRGKLTTARSTPDTAQLLAITSHLGTAPASRVFDTDHLAAMLPDAGIAAEKAAGMMAIPISRTPRDYVLLFRKELVESRTWAGDPDKMATQDGMRISPRKSFAAYQQLVRHHALPFNPTERRVGEVLRSALIEVLLRLADKVPVEISPSNDRQEVLIAELNHRVRNILSLIRGLIAQTNSEGVNTADYVAALGGRVQALAKAHDQVTRKNWSPAPVNALFEDEIAAFMPLRRDRLVVAGPAMLLKPLAFSTLALVVHELVTNSMKYGALSGDGTVAVAIGYVPGAGLSLAWRDIGGPVVVPPTRRGFGSVIVERTVPFDLGGTAEVRYPPTGLEADFFIPDSHVAGESELAVVTAARPESTGDTVLLQPARPLEGRSVLLLEDNLIVAIEAENLLFQLGAAFIWIAATIGEAHATLDREDVTFAMLDINIGQETSIVFADRLKNSGIPFFFASGYGDDAELGKSRHSSVVVRKPYGLQDLLQAAQRVIDGQASC